MNTIEDSIDRTSLREVNILDLCDDILGLIDRQVEINSTYQHKRRPYLMDIKNNNFNLKDCEIPVLLQLPIIYARYDGQDDKGGWWIDDIPANNIGENWVLKDWRDNQYDPTLE